MEIDHLKVGSHISPVRIYIDIQLYIAVRCIYMFANENV